MNNHLLNALRRAVTIRDEEFTLASGRKSKVYIDCRLVTLDAAASRHIGNLFSAWLFDEGAPYAFGGPELGACPIVTATGVVRSSYGKPYLSLFYVRKAPKEHGKGGQIVGPPLEPGTPAILVEDVVTSGGSLLRAIQVCRIAGMVVEKAYCLVDRLEGGRELLLQNGVELKAAITLPELVGEE